MKPCKLCGEPKYERTRNLLCKKHLMEYLKSLDSQSGEHRKNLPLRSERNIYYTMKNRCYNETHNRYENYGGKGIKVCDRWLESFDNFYKDMGARPSREHSLERIDNTGDYEPSNCVWATIDVQSRNKRLYKNNKSGMAGVSRRHDRWYVRIPVDGKEYHVGSFKDLDDAISARLGAEASLW